MKTSGYFGIVIALTFLLLQNNSHSRMKSKRSSSASLCPNGILRWSTLCLLAGSLASCEKESTYIVTEKDASMAKLQTSIDQLDSQRALLNAGEVSNNFHIDPIGYYHAEKREFFPKAYNTLENGLYYVNGEWQEHAGPSYVSPSRPSPEALQKVDLALTQAKKEEETNSSSPTATRQHSGGFGATNMLLMYMLLSGNRGSFTPGAGFQQTQRNVSDLNRRSTEERRTASTYAAGNPGYRKAMEQSKAQGKTIQTGQSLRGGFGSTARGKSFSSGS